MQELEKARKEGLKVCINVKTKQEKDSSKAIKTKRYIAQVLTVLNELEREETAKEKIENRNPKIETNPKPKEETKEKTEKNSKS
jgi:ribosomal protein L29